MREKLLAEIIQEVKKLPTTALLKLQWFVRALTEEKNPKKNT